MLRMLGCMLYRYFDRHGRLLYVGVTTLPEEREFQHRCDSGFSVYVAFVEYERYPSTEAALAAERVAIQTEVPVFNLQGRPWRFGMGLRDAYRLDPANQVISDMARWVKYERAQQRSNFFRGANQ